MNKKLRDTINLHDALQGFGQGREMATTEANLDQQLEGIFHEPLFQVIIDVQKAFDYLDIGKYMGI